MSEQTYTNSLVAQNLERVESEIDRGGLHGLLEIIESVCDLKAEHIRENWQDPDLARTWERAAKVIRTAMKTQAIGSL